MAKKGTSKNRPAEGGKKRPWKSQMRTKLYQNNGRKVVAEEQKGKRRRRGMGLKRGLPKSYIGVRAGGAPLGCAGEILS